MTVCHYFHHIAIPEIVSILATANARLIVTDDTFRPFGIPMDGLQLLIHA